MKNTGVKKIIDVHTHAFPDEIAARAMEKLLSEVEGVPAFADGTLAGLLGSMDRAGIAVSVLASIATRPSQFESILQWSLEIQSDRIIPFASVHPDSPDCLAQIDQIKESGLKGVKMHPYYQQFVLDDPKMMPLYERIAGHNLLLLMHTGYDIAFERIDWAGPERIHNILTQFPGLKMITTHLGAWEQWEDARRYLIGKPVYIEFSYARQFMPVEQFADLLASHPAEYLLFGTDSPWDDQQRVVEFIESLSIDSERRERLFCTNAAALLGLEI